MTSCLLASWPSQQWFATYWCLCQPVSSPRRPQVRDGVLYMLDAWIDVSSAATLFPAVAEAVANPKCIADGKVAGLQW